MACGWGFTVPERPKERVNLDSVVYLGATDTLRHLQTSVTTAVKWAEQYPPELVLWGSEHWRAKSKEPLVRTIESKDSGEGELMGCLREKEASRQGSDPATHRLPLGERHFGGERVRMDGSSADTNILHHP